MKDNRKLYSLRRGARPMQFLYQKMYNSCMAEGFLSEFINRKTAPIVFSGLCLRCGKIFYTRSGYKNAAHYCSQKCGNVSRQKRFYIDCPVCHKKFMRRHCTYNQSKRHFCSYKCWYSFYNGKNVHLWKRGYWVGAQGYKNNCLAEKKSCRAYLYNGENYWKKNAGAWQGSSPSHRPQ